ncbi:YeeE/YedE family protein [Caenibius tardaugens NBRC 16725]|nr:YeeE/YedE family protein [Caenibius tardaugens NBRC 16725]
MRAVLALLTGILFGAGLAVSGMTNPVRVRGFLDVGGRWDPTLVFVMAAAVAVMMLAWRMQRRLLRPLLAEKFVLPTRKDIDLRLVAGAALFGVGWGIAGICPGPAFAMLALLPADATIFLVGLFAGMAVFRLFSSRGRHSR